MSHIDSLQGKKVLCELQFLSYKEEGGVNLEHKVHLKNNEMRITKIESNTVNSMNPSANSHTERPIPASGLSIATCKELP